MSGEQNLIKFNNKEIFPRKHWTMYDIDHTGSKCSGLILNDTSQKFLMNSIFLANSKVMPKATHKADVQKKFA